MTNTPPADPPPYQQPYQPYQPPASGQGYPPPPGPAGAPGPAGPPPVTGPTTGQEPATDSASAPYPGSDPAGSSGDKHERPVGFDPKGRVKRGRVSAAWVGLIGTAIFLILLIIFIAQNLKKATIHFLGFSGHFPIGLTVLIAAVVGLLLVAIPGTIRIFQLRRALKINTPKEERVT